MDFLNKLLKFFREELENKNYTVNLIENTAKSHFFGTEIVGIIAKVSYNPNDLFKLKIGDNINEKTIMNTAVYFAEHEYQHWTSRFDIFNSAEFNAYNPSELALIKEDTHEVTYFKYNNNNLRYLFIEFLIDIYINEDIKRTDNLFIHYNLKRLEEAILDLNIANIKSDINDEGVKKRFIKNLKSEKGLNKILERALRLYGLNQSMLVEKLLKDNDIESFLEILKYVHNSLMTLNNSAMELKVIKETFTEIKRYLEDQDFIKIFFNI